MSQGFRIDSKKVSCQKSRISSKIYCEPLMHAFSPYKDLVESLEYWYEKTKRRITFEYLIWNNINDDFNHINALLSICKRIPSKINLIEYNSIGNSNFESADEIWINNYLNILKDNKIPVSIRRSRGKDIQAACGQLANKH